MPRNRLVLIIDDNAVNLKLARVTLQSAGLEVATASSAEEGLDAIQRAKPGVILMDVQLPGTDGLTLTRRLKADPATRDISIIALTAYAMKGDAQKARDAGCDGYLSKPIDTRTLPGVVLEHLDRRPDAARSPSILLLEDDPSFGKLLRLTLSRAGFVVEWVETVETARVAARERRPDIVISDRHLKPSGDGIAFCAELKRDPATRTVPVIILTGSDAAEVRIEPRLDGPDVYLLKSPETVSKLEGHVNALLSAQGR